MFILVLIFFFNFSFFFGYYEFLIQIVGGGIEIVFMM